MSEHFGFDADGSGDGFTGDGLHADAWGDPGADDPAGHDLDGPDLGHDSLPEGLDDGSDPYGFDHDPDEHSDLVDEHAAHGDLGDQDGFGAPSHGDSAGAIPEHVGGPEAAAFGLDPDPSSGGVDLSYPPPLDVDVAPADGLDWVDPGLLGTEADAGPHFAVAEPDELLASVHTADGGDSEPTWEAMHASDDPATRALAAFWDPLNR